MNKRVFELMKECEFYPNGGEVSEVDYEKFAEALVRECAGLDFKSTGQVTTDGDIVISDFILEHFGIE